MTVREADDEKLPEHCTQTDGEAGPVVFHVGHDMNEKELTDSTNEPFATKKRSRWHASEKKQMKQQQQQQQQQQKNT